jgi:hypothetical protein
LAKDVAVIFCHFRGQTAQTMQSRNIVFLKETLFSQKALIGGQVSASIGYNMG